MWPLDLSALPWEVYYVCISYITLSIFWLELFLTSFHSCLSSAELKGIKKKKKASSACLVCPRKLLCWEQILFSAASLWCIWEKCFPMNFSLFPTSRKSSNFPGSVCCSPYCPWNSLLCATEEAYCAQVLSSVSLITEINVTCLEAANPCSGLLLKMFLFES